jgi:hypothetical protein
MASRLPRSASQENRAAGSDGEVRALLKLLFRLAMQSSVMNLRVPPPMKVSRGSLAVAAGVERAVSAMARRVGPAGGVLILLDADDDCPAELSPALLARARAERSDVPVSVVLANKEFEAWFVGHRPHDNGASGQLGRCSADRGRRGPRSSRRHRDAEHRELAVDAAVAPATHSHGPAAAPPKIILRRVQKRG